MTHRNNLLFASHRQVKICTLLSTGLIIVLRTAISRAEASSAQLNYSRLVMGLSGNIGVAAGSSVPVTDTDYVMRRDVVGLTGLRLMPRWRYSEQWAFGANTGLITHGQGPRGPIDWWDAQVEVRWYPFTSSAPAMWLAGTGGMILAVDRARAARGTEGGPDRPAMTYKTFGPAASLGIGVDTIKNAHFSLGTELRAVYYGLSASSTSSNNWGPTYGPFIGVAVGLTISLQLIQAQS